MSARIGATVGGWKDSILCRLAGLLCSAALAATAFPDAASAQEAKWIWSTEHQKDAVPAGAACHFRKSFTVKTPEAASIALAADDTYELYLNGRRIGVGESTKRLVEYDVSKFVTKGSNLIAIKVVNRAGKTAALVARVTVKEKNGEWTAHSSDDSWRASAAPLPLWNTTIYNDRSWAKAQVFGTLGETAPWDRRDEIPVAAVAVAPAAGADDPNLAPIVDKSQVKKPTPKTTAKTPAAPISKNETKTERPAEEFKEPVAAKLVKNERFEPVDEFEVQQVLTGEQTGSLIAMTFNEFGQIIASKEGGPLLLMVDSDKDGIADKVRTYCDKVKNCQGILALNGDVFVTGEGPDGQGLYRLSKPNKEGQLEDVRTLIKFKSESIEHGPHGLVLGPDGLIYVLLGNYTRIDQEVDPASPHRDFYEGDLVTPRYEDPAGHAVGIKAPGGMVVRTDAEGSGVQIVSGGLRNPYDLTFNHDGEMFVHDADMESDEGLAFYRPTRLLHLVPSGEYGWRSGWATWPEYFVDSLPATLDTGRGSPAGIASYNHFMYPRRYHNCLFTADWAQGKILAVRLKKNGASYTATTEVFVEGNPLNATDLEVGSDGWLYFCTGGRGTGGGIYRVIWKGAVPPQITNIGTGVTAIIRQPQIHSSWARQNIAAEKKKLGDKWDSSLLGVARSAANPANYRLQALDLMQLYGPAPTPEFLIYLSKQQSEQVRAKAAELMGLHPTEETQKQLIELLADTDRSVRRKACEALSRADQAPALDKLLPLLSSDDRFEAWAARRLLERMKLEDWKGELLKSDNHRLYIQGSLALITAYPSRENAQHILKRMETLMEKFVSDKDFIDMLRLAQVSIARGELRPEELGGLRKRLAEEFPAGDPLMNRELIRLLVFLQESTITERYLAYLKSDVSDVDKLHVALHLRFLEKGWTASERMDLLKFYEEAQKRKGGGSYARYLINATRDFTKQLNQEEVALVLEKGAIWPNAALGALYQISEKPDEKTLAQLKELDQQLNDKEGDSFQRLQVGITAVLTRSGDEESFKYLRKVWDENPERRAAVSVGLAQVPSGENWAYVVRSLPYLEPAAAREVCQKLMAVEQAPEEADPYRTIILLGLRALEKDKPADAPIALLQFWTSEELAKDESEKKQLEAWQAWFAKTYPNSPPATLPTAAENAKYTYEELLTYVSGEEMAKANSARGQAIFTKVQCAKCHKLGDIGESMGPDLTTVSRRFTRKEILEAIVHPSHIISSQYASKTISTTDGRTLSGIVAAGAEGETVILQSTGEKVTVKTADIEETKPSNVSSMPAGLLDTLTHEEIGDLFAYLQGTPKPVNLTRKPGAAGTK
ncbi:MAG: HEAT repeat domain-containing protein [Pirellulaceae bacterium]